MSDDLASVLAWLQARGASLRVTYSKQDSHYTVTLSTRGRTARTVRVSHTEFQTAFAKAVATMDGRGAPSFDAPTPGWQSENDE